MPKDEPTSQNKSHKKGQKKLKRIHEGIDQLADGHAGNSLQPESSRPNAKAAAKPPAPIIQAAVPKHGDIKCNARGFKVPLLTN